MKISECVNESFIVKPSIYYTSGFRVGVCFITIRVYIMIKSDIEIPFISLFLMSPLFIVSFTVSQKVERSAVGA